jgi:hypothetical protein
MTDDRVQDNNLPGVGFNVRGADFGQENAQRMDRAVQGAISVGMDIYEREQKFADEAVQLEAGSRLAQFELKQNQKTREARGERAMLRSDEYKSDFAKTQADLAKLARNDRQKAMIGRLVMSTDEQLRNNILANQSRENEEVYKSKALAFIENNSAAAVDSDDPATIEKAVASNQAAMSQLSDFMGEPKEVKEQKMMAVKESLYVDWISQKAVNDPAGALAMLEDKNIQEIIGSQDTLRTLKNFADRQSNIVRRQKKDDLIKGEMQTAADIADGKITTVTQVSKLASDGVISNERATAYIKFLSDKDNTDFGDSEALAVHMDTLFDLGNKDAINTLTNDVFTGGKNGRVNQEEVQTYLKVANIRMQGLSLEEYRDYKEAEKLATRKKAKKEDKVAFEKIKKPMTELDVLYKNISDWSKTYATTPEEKGQIIKDFADWSDKIGKKLNNGEALTIDDAKNDIITKAQTRANPNRSKYKIGDVKVGKNKRIYKVIGYFEDGEPEFDLVK